MAQRHKLLAANWKMHAAPRGFDLPISPYRQASNVDVVVFPSALDIDRCVEVELVVGGQAARSEENGAFTGDLSMAMLAAHGCQAVLCGHSERRVYHGEIDATINKQLHAAVAHGLLPFLCVGEALQEREGGRAFERVAEQLEKALKGFDSTMVIAYEPVWAIGTGKNASPADIQAMHEFIHSQLPEPLKNTPLLYGGSVRPENADEIFACPNVDGALVGGASLDPRDFGRILESLQSSPS